MSKKTTESFPGVFPQEILLEIFSFLPTGTDIANCGKTCKQWQKLVHEPKLANKMWRYIKEEDILLAAESWEDAYRIKKADVSRAKILIEDAMLKDSRYVYIRKLSIPAIPSNLFLLSKLQYLDFAHNFLSQLPVQITNLQKLQTLYLDHNQFRTFPLVVVQLTSLQSLDFNSNLLVAIPSDITKLTNLQMLRIAFNKIVSLPNMESMKKLTKCEVNENGTIPFMKFPSHTKVVKDVFVEEFKVRKLANK